VAWTTPRTWVSGELVTAALFNTHLRDNLSALDGGRLAITSQAAGDVVYASSSTALARLAKDAGKFLKSGASAVSWDTISFSTVSPLTTRGDVLYSSSGTVTGTRLAIGSANTFLKSDGTDVSWSAVGGSHTGVISGRLTLTSGLAVTTADVTGAGTLYFTPYNGATIDLYTGSAWTQVTFAEMSIALSGGSASKPHDVFLDYNGGSPALAILTWTNDTTRATALTTQNSILVKTGDTQQRYLGTIYSDGSKQCADSYAKRHVWNYYNRVTRPMRVLEPTDTWVYTTATWRQARATTTNQVDLVCGVAQDGIEVSVFAHCNNSSGNVQQSVSVGENSTTAPATGALIGRLDETNTSSIEPVQTTLRALPAAGRNYYVWLEYSQAVGTSTWYGDAGGVNIRSGIVAMWWG
jgi:hypothetical protein